MDNNLPNMDNNPIPPELDSLKESLSTNPSLNKDSKNPTDPELLYATHKHM
jgi:hypothetical protein